jgi:S-formylglutathione hydrolase FrmB
MHRYAANRGYDPGYDFIFTFIGEHLAWHAERLAAG